jgi:perosamine synthetase
MIPAFRPCLGPEELQGVSSVFDSRHLGLGEVTREFERRLSQFLQVKHVVAVSHGTAALHLALDALELEPGDEVIVPSLTFVATVQAILMAGAVPVFCEVKPDTLNLDITDAFGRVTSRSRAIMPVHFAGLPCEMGSLLREARLREISVVEDAAHAFGACHQGHKIGSLGDLTCFSFDAIKNITCGEGGAIATESDELAAGLARRRRLGMAHGFQSGDPAEAHWQYHVVSRGFRYHMPDINAAIGLKQLEKFSAFQARRREIVERYDRAFGGLPGLEPIQHDLEQTCPWAYVVKVAGGRRNSFREYLVRQGIQTLVQFIPNHLQPAFAKFRVDLPVTEELFEQIVSLPLFVEMTDAQVETVIEAVQGFTKKADARATERSVK